MRTNDLEKLIYDEPCKCSKCGGKLEYLGLGEYQCLECGNEVLDDYAKIRKYFSVHGPAPAVLVAKETGISRNRIEDLLRKGISETPLKDDLGTVCKKCGAGISSGRYCAGCSGSPFQERKGRKTLSASKEMNLSKQNGFGHYLKKSK
ncbi:hypothetical protein D3Z36_04975 [Lachnospiraceae bacterium]|nr:hypothetical protein [Lachnospiraceae bacterium]